MYFQGDRGADGLLTHPLESRETLLDATPDARYATQGNCPVANERSFPVSGLGGVTHSLLLQCEALQTSLWLRYTEAATRITLFVGADRHCGVSTVAAGFVRALSRDPGARILFVDFSASTPAANSPASPASDLLDLLEPSHPRRSPSWGLVPNVHVLSGISFGCVRPSLFLSKAFDRFLHAARERFDHVVIDAPPLQGRPESLILSCKADGVVLVVRSGQTRRQSALWAKQQIENAHGRVLGVVLNRRRFYVPRWLYERF